MQLLFDLTENCHGLMDDEILRPFVSVTLFQSYQDDGSVIMMMIITLFTVECHGNVIRNKDQTLGFLISFYLHIKL